MFEDSTDGMRGALMTALENRGAVAKIKAQIRAEVHAALNSEAAPAPSSLPNDIYLAGEIVKDFLVRMKCENTLSVLSAELGVDKDQDLQRDFMLQELGIQDAAGQRDIPVLLLIMQHAMRRNKAAVDCASQS